MDPWRSRGYLPHFDQPGAHQSLTFRLADALPADVVARLQRAIPDDDTARRRQIEAWMDRGRGECLLRDAENADIVEHALLVGDGTAYRLLAWAIMPNHVHVLIATIAGHPVAEIVRRWKGATARQINLRRGRSGSLWQREYWDRFIRDEGHFAWAMDYIEGNPVQAGLAKTPSAWRWSSAWRRASGGNGKAPAG